MLCTLLAFNPIQGAWRLGERWRCLQVALIERGKTRHIVNLPDMLAACNNELTAWLGAPAGLLSPQL